MAKPQHRTSEYRTALKVCRALVGAGDAWCVEPRCLEERDGRTRWIAPGMRWSVSHDVTGTVILGPSHHRCNMSEAAIRGNRMRARARRRWDL